MFVIQLTLAICTGNVQAEILKTGATSSCMFDENAC